ncbi:MAG: ABC transporter substrate-binding protein [Planctomycetota bacterium]|nr:MAG: ABC transporter substrate-binding protein [Planctomycetota bacterium]
MTTTTRTLTLGHSPDPDDAFMFYALAREKIDTAGWRFRHVLEDIQTLNERAMRAELDITAISIHAYPYVAKDYVLTACGSSMGDGYGPIVVAREPMPIDALRGATIAVPGEKTTAFLVLNLLLGRGTFRHEVVMFDQIPARVAEGKADAGLVIHEGQLTYTDHHLHKVADLGAWWKEQTDLPLPLGGNVIRRALGAEAMREVSGILRRSIEYGLTHREEAVAYALDFARDMGEELADRFVGMYVNEWTVDYGPVGKRAIRELLRQGYEAGLVPGVGDIEFV